MLPSNGLSRSAVAANNHRNSFRSCVGDNADIAVPHSSTCVGNTLMLAPRSISDIAPPTEPVFAALTSCRRALIEIGVFSGCIGVLSLTGSLYMLQISDRVLSSRSIATLVGLSLLALAAYLLHGALDALRCRMLARVGAKFSEALVGRVYDAVTTLSLKGIRPAVTTQAVRDLDQVQRFLSGTGPTALFDLPFL